MGSFPTPHSSRADPRARDGGRLQLVLGRAAHDHLPAAAADDSPPVAFAAAALRPPPLALRIPDRHLRLGALHPGAEARAALARPGRLGGRPRAARDARPARGGRAAAAPRVGRGRPGGRRARLPLASRSRAAPAPAARAHGSRSPPGSSSPVAVRPRDRPGRIAARARAPASGSPPASSTPPPTSARRRRCTAGRSSSSAFPSGSAICSPSRLIQLAFQRGRALATAGLSSFCTNALPIAAGLAIFHETRRQASSARCASSPSAASSSARRGRPPRAGGPAEPERAPEPRSGGPTGGGCRHRQRIDAREYLHMSSRRSRR